MANIERIKPVIERKLEQLGLELYELQYHAQGARSSLRVFIDRAQGATVQDCENASKELSLVLDVENFSKAPYHLEVSTPGIDRDLKTARDFTRMIGKPVVVYLRQTINDKTQLEGIVEAVDETEISLQTPQGTQSINLDDISKGKFSFQAAKASGAKK